MMLTFFYFLGLMIGGSFCLFLFFRGAPFLPSDKETIQRMISLAKIQPGEKAADLGSGTGRILIALAKAGAQAHGYEINPILVWWSRWQIKRLGLSDRAFVHYKNFWNENLSQFKIVTVFGINYMMPKLEKKLLRELPKGARVLSNSFRFPNWKFSAKEKNVYLYLKE